MARTPTVDQHATDIEYIKKDIADIKERLERKYVSHETFDLSVQSLNDAIGLMTKVAMFVITPIYAAVIALMFKIFTQ